MTKILKTLFKTKYQLIFCPDNLLFCFDFFFWHLLLLFPTSLPKTKTEERSPGSFSENLNQNIYTQ